MVSLAAQQHDPTAGVADLVPGIGAADISKLKGSNLHTVAAVKACTKRKLLLIKGFSDVKVDKIKDAVKKCLVSSSQGRHSFSCSSSPAARHRISYCQGASRNSKELLPYLDRQQAVGCHSRRRLRVEERQRGLRRVQMRQDPARSHSLCDGPAAEGPRGCCWKSRCDWYVSPVKLVRMEVLNRRCRHRGHL